MLLFVLVSLWTAPVFSSVESHDRLVYRLQNIVNEFELLIKNHHADIADLRRQNREMDLLKVYERIPLGDDIAGLKRQLETSARESGVEFIGLNVTSRSGAPLPVPKTVPSDGPRFEFTEDQLLETLSVAVLIKGSEVNARKWIRALPDNQLRLVHAGNADLRPEGPGRWTLRARAYRFRDVLFPTIIPVDPRRIARGASADDPIVKDLIARAMSLRDRAAPLYRTRGELFLNTARMRLYATKGGT